MWPCQSMFVRLLGDVVYLLSLGRPRSAARVRAAREAQPSPQRNAHKRKIRQTSQARHALDSFCCRDKGMSSRPQQMQYVKDNRTQLLLSKAVRYTSGGLRVHVHRAAQRYCSALPPCFFLGVGIYCCSMDRQFCFQGQFLVTSVCSPFGFRGRYSFHWNRGVCHSMG